VFTYTHVNCLICHQYYIELGKQTALVYKRSKKTEDFNFSVCHNSEGGIFGIHTQSHSISILSLHKECKVQSLSHSLKLNKLAQIRGQHSTMLRCKHNIAHGLITSYDYFAMRDPFHAIYSVFKLENAG